MGQALPPGIFLASCQATQGLGFGFGLPTRLPALRLSPTAPFQPTRAARPRRYRANSRNCGRLQTAGNELRTPWPTAHHGSADWAPKYRRRLPGIVFVFERAGIHVNLHRQFRAIDELLGQPPCRCSCHCSPRDLATWFDCSGKAQGVLGRVMTSSRSSSSPDRKSRSCDAGSSRRQSKHCVSVSPA